MHDFTILKEFECAFAWEIFVYFSVSQRAQDKSPDPVINLLEFEIQSKSKIGAKCPSMLSFQLINKL